MMHPEHVADEIFDILEAAGSEDLAVIRAVLDDTGTHDGSPYSACVGVVAGRQPWKRFDREWRLVLKEYGVSDMHARRFFAKDNEGNRVGLYRGWSDEEWRSFLARMLTLFRSMKAKVIACAVETRYFTQLSQSERAFWTGRTFHLREDRTQGTGAPETPFFFAFNSVVAQALDFGGRTTPAAVVLDRNDKCKHHAQVLCDEMNASKDYRGLIHSFTTAPRTEFVSLQLADLVAYTLYRYLTKNLTDDLDWVMGRIDSKCTDIKVFDEETHSKVRCLIPEDVRKRF